MAQLIPGKTSCVLCGTPVKRETHAIAFPAFVPQGHEFSSYSDAVFHRVCFEQWDAHRRYQQLFDNYQQVWKSRPSGLSLEEMEAWGQQAFEKVFSHGMVHSE